MKCSVPSVDSVSVKTEQVQQKHWRELWKRLDRACSSSEDAAAVNVNVPEEFSAPECVDMKCSLFSSVMPGATPLYLAARRGSVSVVRHLLSCKANVDAMSYGGTTPLWVACKYGHNGVVQELLECKADPRLGASRLKTCIYVAVERGHITPPMIKLLLECKADASIDCSKDFALHPARSPLFLSILHGNGKIAHLIGCRTDACQFSCCTSQDVLQLLKHIDDNLAAYQDWMPNNEFFERNVFEVLILAAGVDGNEQHAQAFPQLLRVALRVCGKLGMAWLADCIDEDDLHSLLTATVENFRSVSPEEAFDIVQMLVENGADINQRDGRGQSALTTFCSYPWNAEKRQLGCAFALNLIRLKADVNQRDEDGKTPLYAASEAGVKGLLPLLYERGHNVEALKESDGQNGDKGNDGTNPLWALCNMCSFEDDQEVDYVGAAKELLSRKALVNFSNESLVTPLHAACSQLHSGPLVNILLSYGADAFEAKDASGRTALDVAKKTATEHNDDSALSALLDTVRKRRQAEIAEARATMARTSLLEELALEDEREKQKEQKTRKKRGKQKRKKKKQAKGDQEPAAAPPPPPHTYTPPPHACAKAPELDAAGVGERRERSTPTTARGRDEAPQSTAVSTKKASEDPRKETAAKPGSVPPPPARCGGSVALGPNLSLEVPTRLLYAGYRSVTALGRFEGRAAALEVRALNRSVHFDDDGEPLFGEQEPSASAQLHDDEGCVVCMERPRNVVVVHGDAGLACAVMCKVCALAIKASEQPCVQCQRPIDAVLSLQV